MTSFAPGHPPIPFTAIRELDKRRWDRKGIAIVKYEVEGRGGVVTIDDFLYDQTPTDAIYDRILKYVSPPAPEVEQVAQSEKEEAQS